MFVFCGSLARYALSVVACSILATSTAFGADAPPAKTPGVVSYIKVVSDKVEDVSSLEAWKQSFIKPGMTEQQKAVAVWESVVKFRHQDPPPNEYLAAESAVHDPIKSFNVYGYGMCSCASSNIEQLARYAGLQARAWGITGHSVPELNIDGHWAMFDASLINYFRKPDGTIAGVQEISRSISDWYAEHPEYRNDSQKLTRFMRGGGWRQGPSILAGGTGYDDNGWFPAATHGWYSSMQEFNEKKNFLYEYGAAIGYEVNIQLRPGEKLIRNWSNKGLHVNMHDGNAPGALTGSAGKDQLRYSPGFGDLGPGRIGNGTLTYDLPLASGGFRAGMLVADNLACRAGTDTGPAVRVDDPARAAELTFRMPSSYVYLTGDLSLSPVVGPGGAISVHFSDNNGLDWKPLARITATGEQKIDLSPLVFRRYDYRLKVLLEGKGTGLDALKVSHDIQHSQRALPALDSGENHLRFTAGPAEGTITVQGAINPQAPGKNLTYADFHPTLARLDPRTLAVKGTTGQITFPVDTPGDITRLRIGVHYRARDEANDGWTVEASFDSGKLWKQIADLTGPTGSGNSKYLVFADVPAGCRAAAVRFSGRQRNTTMLMDVRISADYLEPHGGFSPVKVTYTWEEAGQARHDVHVAGGVNEPYTICCATKPLMKSITLEMP